MEQTNYAIMYPELSEEGIANTQQLINKFKDRLEELMNNTLYAFTSNLANEIVNDDSWIDVRQKTKEALCGYNNKYGGVDWPTVRKKILEENRDEIVNDIILDKEKEILDWQDRYNHLQQSRY